MLHPARHRRILHTLRRAHRQEHEQLRVSRRAFAFVVSLPQQTRVSGQHTLESSGGAAARVGVTTQNTRRLQPARASTPGTLRAAGWGAPTPARVGTEHPSPGKRRFGRVGLGKQKRVHIPYQTMRDARAHAHPRCSDMRCALRFRPAHRPPMNKLKPPNTLKDTAHVVPKPKLVCPCSSARPWRVPCNADRREVLARAQGRDGLEGSLAGP